MGKKHKKKKTASDGKQSLSKREKTEFDKLMKRYLSKQHRIDF